VLAHKPHPMLASRTGLLESLSPGDRQVPIFLGASLPRFDRHGEIEVGGGTLQISRRRAGSDVVAPPGRKSPRYSP
jgi:hypothetical protein